MTDRDDFEFRPLTEGLGFHKKSIELRDDLRAELENIELTTGILPKSKINPTPVSTPKPAPRKPSQSQIHPQTAWAASLQNLDFDEQKSRRGVLKPLAANWASGLFDTAMVLGLTLIFSTVIFALTGIEFTELIDLLKDDGGAQLATLVLLFAVFEIYTILGRSFFGKTLGEYSFDCRLGAPHEQQNLLYPILVAWRTFLITITGFILLPLISSLIGRDVAGSLSGLNLYSDRA